MARQPLFQRNQQLQLHVNPEDSSSFLGTVKDVRTKELLMYILLKMALVYQKAINYTETVTGLNNVKVETTRFLVKGMIN